MLKWPRKCLYHRQLSHNRTPMETMPAVGLLVQVTLETKRGPHLLGLHNSSLQERLLVRDLVLNAVAVAVVHVRRALSRLGLALRLTDLHRPHLNKLPRKWPVVVPVTILE